MLLRVLPSALDAQLDKSFGSDAYPFLIAHRRPWTVNDMLSIIIEKWMTAFCDCYPRDPSMLLMLLINTQVVF
jgi:hypothetical protein